MPHKFSDRSAERIAECHPDLVRLFEAVLALADCTILCGYRGEREQNAYYRDGRSKLPWPKSLHNRKPALAVDVAPYPIDFSDLARFRAFAEVVKNCAKALQIEVEWGGDWAGFKDMPHWQLKIPHKPPTS